jgi:hypothetical protein
LSFGVVRFPLIVVISASAGDIERLGGVLEGRERATCGGDAVLADRATLEVVIVDDPSVITDRSTLDDGAAEHFFVLSDWFVVRGRTSDDPVVFVVGPAFGGAVSAVVE